ncbi:N-acetyltransferase [Anaerocolumna cellulosilytica]|uniref:N-acetyltransferase n=1 Tax=Anaerocolumna cellulosilytica TaxID=433286 RepID=A0A6S6R1U8_9FIRM|nr:N-acetyltransferase [Anaerocolumna cellulosilytica]MBB5197870.1 diamine N-acetyltransferase [Anaerocolumna cellulosilytica]BCJ93181.1 N-acetyltransferase [Anaerocolumna cellulosilytica]
MIELRKIDSKNVWKVIRLTVDAEQEDFVATNTESIIEAYTTITAGGVALPFGIYDKDCLVGFVMFGYGTSGDEDDPVIARDNYCIWRFMIDKNYQHQGIGKKALLASLEYLKSMPCGKAEYCWLSYEPENVIAKKLYSSVGFHENGEVCGDEIVSVLKLHNNK